MDYAHEFWTGDHKYQELAKQYEQNVEITHPPTGASCWCGAHCPWARTSVIRYEYTGESV